MRRDADGMAHPVPADPTAEREVVGATVELAPLETIARPRRGTAHVLIELEATLLEDVTLWLAGDRLEFTVVDPVRGTVTVRGDTLGRSQWPFSLVRTVLDRVGVRLLAEERAG